MCGICGAIQLEGEPRPPLARPLLDRMTDLMTHRGPNDRGTHLAAGVALGVRRLSIVDLAGGHRAVLARDRLGVKPLYYARADGLLLFASELKSLLASGLIDPELDYEALDAYLTLGYVPAPRTPLRGVSKLLPGHLLAVED